MQARGRFITLEGGEGAGKSVQAKRLEERLAALGLAVVRTREPGGSPGAEALREAILSGFAAGLQRRRAGVAVRRRPRRPSRQDDSAGARERRLGRFRPVRRFDPRLSRRGGESAAGVHRLARAPDGGREPARPDADPRPRPGSRPQARGRAKTEQGPADRFESEGLPFHQTLRRAFLDIAAAEPSRCVVIDADRSEDDVAAAIWSAVESRLDPAGALKAKLA